MNQSRLFAILGFILLGVLSRFLPHPPNFTALNSLALFGACFLGSLSLSLLTVFTAMIITYLSFALIVLMGHWLLKEKSLRRAPIFYFILSSLIFFVVSNFGVWVTDPFYPKTLTGLGLCYLSALPFLANQILGDLSYGVVMF